MRIYTHEKGSHYVNALHAIDDPRHGREYVVVSGVQSMFLNFQAGPIGEGHDELINEQLLALLTHRITVLQSRAPCEENVQVLAHLTEAQALLECRERQLSQ